jgi:uncharacterized protein HemX
MILGEILATDQHPSIAPESQPTGEVTAPMKSKNSDTEFETATKASAGNKLKGLATTIALMALSGLIGYGAAWWQGSQQLSSADQARQELGKQLDATKAQVADAQAGTQLMKASTELHQVSAELADRNFGIAQKRLKTTQDLFAAIEAKGTNSAKIDALKKDIAAIEINFVTNPEDMKKRLTGLADQIQAIVP